MGVENFGAAPPNSLRTRILALRPSRKPWLASDTRACYEAAPDYTDGATLRSPLALPSGAETILHLNIPAETPH